MGSNETSESYVVLTTPKIYKLNRIFDRKSPNLMDIERIGNLLKDTYEVKSTALPEINGNKWFCGLHIKNYEGCAYLLFPLQNWKYNEGSFQHGVTVLTKGNLDVKDINDFLEKVYTELSKQDPYYIKAEWSAEEGIDAENW